MWEQVEILETSGNWYRVRQVDNYTGWIHKFYTQTGGKQEKRSGVVVSERHAKIYKRPERTVPILAEVVFGTKLPETGKENGWHQVELPGGDSGWLEHQKMPGHFSRGNLLGTAEKLMGVPYLWGGRTAYGFDCSGFVQTVFKFWGLDIPRDSGEQFALTSLESIELHSCVPCDLIFFRRGGTIVHVGIATGTGSIVHCQGMVRIDPLFSGDNLVSASLQDTEPEARSIERLIRDMSPERDAEFEGWN